MKWLSTAAACLLLASCAGTPGTTADSPLELLPAKPEKGTLFRYYQERSESVWKRNWTHDLDFTGVSWNHPTCATLVTPSHVVMAAHFIRPKHVAVMFHDRAGQPIERYIVDVRSLAQVGDVAVGKLNLPVPADIEIYDLASPGDAVPGTPVITTDQTMTASVHRIDFLNGRNIFLSYVPEIDPVYRRDLTFGDSGHPTFVLKNGKLLLLETHTFGGPGRGPFYGNPEIKAAIQQAVNEMGG